MDLFPICLALERSDAIKLAAVDALITIFVEVRLFFGLIVVRVLTSLQSRKYPWFQPVEVLRQFAPAIRKTFCVRPQTV